MELNNRELGNQSKVRWGISCGDVIWRPIKSVAGLMSSNEKCGGAQLLPSKKCGGRGLPAGKSVVDGYLCWLG